MDFLHDHNFLLKVNQYHIKEYQCAILVLNFADEEPICRLETKVISGNISIDAKSSTRRTANLSLICTKEMLDIQNLNSLIGINRKISISIGITNPLFFKDEYKQYGETLWFKQGVFIITSASFQFQGNTSTVSLNLIDKMGMLNGTCGGTLPASTHFHDKIQIDKDGNITTTFPTIEQIIRETVHHFGGEHFSRIVVEDVPPIGRLTVSWDGTTPICFDNPSNRVNNGANYVLSTTRPGYDNIFFRGDKVGFMETDLTYPGELILKAGSTVTQVLDEIVKVLGNFEYYYDVEGVFHFKRIENFQQTENAPLIAAPELFTSTSTPEQVNAQVDTSIYNLYFPRFSDTQFLNDLWDTSLINSISKSPEYKNIKNDWICWGTRKDSSNTQDIQKIVRYHLAIDTRPKDLGTASLCRKNIYQIIDQASGETVRYSHNALANYGEQAILFAPALTTPSAGWVLQNPFTEDFNWREELYRAALMAYGSSTRASYYDEELLAEWRLIYDPMSTVANKGVDSFEQMWIDEFGTSSTADRWNGYRVDILRAPERIQYWLDIIDPDQVSSSGLSFISNLSKYSVDNIGRRSKITENSKINEVISNEVFDIVFIDGSLPADKLAEKRQYYISIGQDYCQVRPEQMNYFIYNNSFGTCFEEVRAMMYETLCYNTSVTISCLPLLYLDVNRVIKLNYPELGVVGDYLIKNLSWNIIPTQMMNLTAHEIFPII